MGDRLDTTYMDKLDGLIDNDFFDRKAAEFRAVQCHIMNDVAMHQEVSKGYAAQGLGKSLPRLLDNKGRRQAVKSRFISSTILSPSKRRSRPRRIRSLEGGGEPPFAPRPGSWWLR